MRKLMPSNSTSVFRPPVSLVKGDGVDKFVGLIGQDAAAELMDIAARLARAARLEDGTRIHTCITCGKKEILRTLDRLVTDPATKKPVLDPRCDGCRHSLREACPVVCHNCGEIVALLDPGPKGYGYVATKGKFLHAAACPTCLDLFMVKKGLQVTAPILEIKAAECRERGLDLKLVMRDWMQDLETRRNAAVRGL